MSGSIKILDTTLRDGSYANNFSFTTADTSIICKELEDAGIDYIEIGHGVGLNAGNCGYGVAVHTDEEYMIAAQNVLKKAKYGMFCIPGIAEIKDIDIAADHKMDFIRIGTNVTEAYKSKDFIKRAKHHGMIVAANFMKSYALPPVEFAQMVKMAEEFGADIVYIVDSAGGMFSHEIKAYFEAIRDATNIPLGFHGHDNLGLAVANSLEAVKLGFDFIDVSLQGLGRSAGNASLELIAATLIKLGYNIKIDLLKLLEIGSKYINPLINYKGKIPMDIVAGFADFHSSYMHYILKYSAKYSVNPALLIIEISKVDKVNVNERVLEEVAQRLQRHEHLYLGSYNMGRYIGHEQDER
jgi:4-hydroxy-2-oxovalerate aldolase